MLTDYNIDFAKLITQYLSTFKRKTVRIRWLMALTSHLKTLHTAFISHFNAQKEEMKWVGQTCTLERYLQIRFDIEEIAIVNNVFISNAIIGYPCPSNNNLIGYSAESDESPIGYEPDDPLQYYGFTVQVPTGSDYNADEMTAVIKRYQIGASFFEIVEV